MRTGVLRGNLKERGLFEESGIPMETVLEWILKRSFGSALTGLIWLRIG